MSLRRFDCLRLRVLTLLADRLRISPPRTRTTAVQPVKGL
jgi:hypothetical protein